MMDWAVTVPGLIQEMNTVFWTITNVLVAFTMVLLVVFVIIYYALFDPRATTAGRFVFRFMLALVGVIGLSVLGIIFDPAHGRYSAYVPIDELWWRPFVRMVIYGYVAYSVTALAILVVLRKWWPHKIHTAKTRELLETRR